MAALRLEAHPSLTRQLSLLALMSLLGKYLSKASLEHCVSERLGLYAISYLQTPSSDVLTLSIQFDIQVNSKQQLLLLVIVSAPYAPA